MDWALSHLLLKDVVHGRGLVPRVKAAARRLRVRLDTHNSRQQNERCDEDHADHAHGCVCNVPRLLLLLLQGSRVGYYAALRTEDLGAYGGDK